MKTQMKFQKILAIISLVTAAVAIVISLFFCSGILNAIRMYSVEMQDGADLFKADALFVYSQKINDTLVIMSIILLLCSVALIFMGCSKRRNYYISNYVTLGIYAAYALAFIIALLVISGKCFSLMNQIDFAEWKEYESTLIPGTDQLRYKQYYTKDCTTMVLLIVVAVVVLLEIAAWSLALVWKLKLMKGEKQLLANGGVSQVAEMEVA